MNKSRIKLLFVFAMFLGPLLVAFVWYYGVGDTFLPKGMSNHAPLVTPVVTLQEFSSSDALGNEIVLASVRGKWSVVHLLSNGCDELCEKSLYNTRQTRLALGKDSHRVQRIVISDNPVTLDKIAPGQPDTLRLRAAADGIETQLLPIIKARSLGKDDALLVDPLGNVMMVIPVDLDPGLLLKDLKKLLKVSRIG